MNPKLASFIIPCYKSERTVEGVVNEIRNTLKLKNCPYEIVLVCDSSPDSVYDVICRLAQEDKNIHGICFSKNFGQHSALMAGMRKVTGDVIICLDDDGQTPASDSIRLIEALDNTTDVVYASYLMSSGKKKHTFFRNFGSSLNNLMLAVLLKKPKALEITSFFAAKRFIIDEACRYENPYPYAIGLILRSTSRIKNIPVIHRVRESGSSGYTFHKLLSLWMNGFTAFSVVPLRIATSIGLVFSLSGFFYTLFLILKKFVDPTVPLGYSSIMAAILVIGGLLMIMVGLLGEYVGRIYLSINKCPQYVIGEDTDRSL